MTKNVTYKALIIILLFISVNSFQPLSAHFKQKFQFRKDHTFKIAQFTDVHWDNTSPTRTKTIEIIQQVLDNEKPDLAIFTGDIVTDVPAKDGWLAIAKIFNDAKIPFAVALGNHDAEPEITREQIFELLETQPLFAGREGSDLSGCGNYTLPVAASEGKSVAAVIYCIDSNSYPTDKQLGSYDWIRFNQIDWYRKTSDKFTALNKKTPIPSVAFFHIPLIEFNNVVGKKSTVGIKNEGIASADINSGLFASMIEKKDVMGIFVGHDHDNNYIGTYQNICMAFGQVTGADAYGKFERGARIIELQEGKFSFETWIRTNSGVQYKTGNPKETK